MNKKDLKVLKSDYKRKFKFLVIDFTGEKEELTNKIYTETYDKCLPYIELESININWGNTASEYLKNLYRYLCIDKEKFFAYVFIINDYKDIIQANLLRKQNKDAKIFVIDTNEIGFCWNALVDTLVNDNIDIEQEKNVDMIIKSLYEHINFVSSASVESITKTMSTIGYLLQEK